MGTFVLLAAFLLVASATPIEHSSGTSDGDILDTNSEDGQSSLPGDGSVSDAERGSQPGDPSPEDGSQSGPSSQEGGSHSGHPSSEDGSQARQPSHEDDSPSGPPSHEGGPASSGEGSSVGETTSTPVSTASEESTSPTTTQFVTDLTNETAVNITNEKFPASPNETVTLPPDSDPPDCRNGSQLGHIFLQCEFECQGDQMEVAPPNATCYLYPPTAKTELRYNEMDNYTEVNSNETGVCLEGKCVPRPTDVPGFTTQSSPAESSTTQLVADSTQETGDLFTTPPDADPYDCRNATQRGHIYLACTYGCGGDEVLTASNNETCYIYPPNVTTEMVMSGQYNLSELHTNKTGVCFQGKCVEMSAETTTAATESSPAQNTSPETASETQSPVNGQPSVVTEKPNNLPESLPEPSQPRNTSAEAGGSSPHDTVTHNNLGQVEETSSTATNGPGTNVPDAVPEALPALT